MTLEQLKREQTRVENLYYTASRAYQANRRAKLDEATKLIDAELLPEKQAMDSLSTENYKAKHAVEDELVRLANEGGQHKYSPGTKLFRVSGSRWNSPSTTLFGILEVVTRETVFPENTSSYRVPKPGSFIVRVCTKDGNPGKKFEGWSEHSDWKPVEETAK